MSCDLIAETFLEMHAEENHAGRPLPRECPICQIQAEDTRVSFAMYLQEKIEPLIEDYLVRWDRLGYAIGNKTDGIPDGLALAIVEAILSHPLVPKPQEQPFEAVDLLRHPYVNAKLAELTPAKGKSTQ
jgi:hypothetical protein